jgi:hypothetical protein
MRVVTSIGFVWMIAAVTSVVNASETAQPLLGTWKTHHATTFLTISIQPAGDALVYWDWDGSHSVYRTHWQEMKNGLMVEGFPRFRFWTTEGNGPPSMRMEPIDPGLEVSDEMRDFPVEHRMIPVAAEERREWANRPLPSGWEAELPPVIK